MNFEFATTAQIYFGSGIVQRIGEIVKHAGQRALAVTGRDPSRAAKLLAKLPADEMSAVTFSVGGEPEVSTVERGVAFARGEQCDFVIAVGGGSVIDAGKAIAAMLTNGGELLDYLEVIGRGKALTKRSVPFIAVPTTAGTGSEVTRNAVLASPEHKVKVSLRGSMLLPCVAVIDPELTYDLPPELTASTGLDALTQLIEPFVCLRANPLVDALCVDGMRRAAKSLRAAVSNGRDRTAREDMSLASLYGGLALANTGLGAVHGFAGPIGGRFPAPHGAVCAALLPQVMAANIRALREREPDSFALRRYYKIARTLTGNPHATADAGVEWVQQLVTGLLIPPLGSYGLRREHVGEVVAKAVNASSMKANPITLTAEELAEILQAAL